MQRYFQEKVLPLLEEHFEDLDTLWQHHPHDLVTASAVTVKEFMQHRQITAPSAGVMAFLSFKREQAQLLAELGLAPGSKDGAQASSPQLTTQVA